MKYFQVYIWNIIIEKDTAANINWKSWHYIMLMGIQVYNSYSGLP